MTTSAGYRIVELHDAYDGHAFPMVAMYPSDAPETSQQVGPYRLDVARDALPIAGRHPLVLLSHGTGGTPFAYRDLARHLARHGFVVGMPEHPHNNRNDDSLANTVQNLINRPRHLRVAADWFFGDAIFGPALKADALSVIGHSMGGYTALAAAGGVPTSLPDESVERQCRRLDIACDHRIDRLVLLAPATVWFREAGALDKVALPMLMLIGDADSHAPAAYHGQLVARGVPDAARLRYRLIDNAGHFAFLTPFPAAMCDPAFAPSQDPHGFERARFQQQLHEEIVDFLREGA